MEDYIPESYTELKRAPRRHLAKKKLDDLKAYQAFTSDMAIHIKVAMNQMINYTIMHFKKYSKSSQFLAFVGTGPFWRYAFIFRKDCPWPEPNKKPHNHRALREKFYDLFGDTYFEIGTVRSDNELTKIRRVYFMKETGSLAYQPEAQEGIKDAGSSNTSGGSQSRGSQSEGTRAGSGQVGSDKANDSEVWDGQAETSQLKGSSTRDSTRSKGQK